MEKKIYDDRKNFSISRLELLKKGFEGNSVIRSFDDVAIFCAGSYGRMEAHNKSDIDLFFISDKCESQINKEQWRYCEMINEVVKIVKKTSVDNISEQYLRVLGVEEMIKNLGGAEDDYFNHFTTRMLLLLESYPLFNNEKYEIALERCVSSYFRDYPNHRSNFRPIFLFNDIVRYWKTLCLNYENKRNGSYIGEKTNVKQKVKNFKLKYSRLTTCFATIIALSCYDRTVKQKDVISLTNFTPVERLKKVIELNGDYSFHVKKILDKYYGFLELVSLGDDELMKYFDSTEKRKKEFEKANQYGNDIYALLECVNGKECSMNGNVLRYLVV